MAIIGGNIRCSRCETFKAADANNFQPSVITRGSGVCKPCKHAQKREYYRRNREKCANKRHEKRKENLEHHKKVVSLWRKNNPEKQICYNLKWKYGITLKEYKKMLASQLHSCACCRVSADDEKLFVDHCHETGEIRGLICKKCNSAIGYLGDNVEGVMQAVNYLKGN